MLIQRLFVLLPLLLLSPVVLAQTDDDLGVAEEGHRQLAVPSWWDFISSTYDGAAPLKRCFKRSAAPVNASVCGNKDKTCFFGTQEECATGAQPETKCTCDGSTGSRAWACEAYPICESEPQVKPNGCPVDGLGFEIFNDALCPATSPSGDCLIAGLKCQYGDVGCCGFCGPQVYATCDGTRNSWILAVVDTNCYQPSCETATFPDSIGSTCDAAKAAVLNQFPKMTAICLSDTDEMPTDDDYERFVIVVADGAVTNIFFNRNVECPSYDEYKASDGRCPVRGQQCTFVNSDVSSGFTSTDECTCVSGGYVCLSSVSLVPPQIQAIEINP